MLREYRWRGETWQIADEDLPRFPGAVPVDAEVKAKKRTTPANKSRRAQTK